MFGWLQRLVTLPRTVLALGAGGPLLLAVIAATYLAYKYEGTLARAESSTEAVAGWRAEVVAVVLLVLAGSAVVLGASLLAARQFALRQRHAAHADGQNRILELVARGSPLNETLEVLCRLVESASKRVRCSVLLMDRDGRRLRHGAGPSLPEAFNRAVDGVPIGPNAGSCGSAAYRRQPVVVTDVANDPRWAEYKHLALRHGMLACWSVPILDAGGEVLGTFCMYYGETRAPSAQDRELVAAATYLGRIAIQRDQGDKALSEREERLRSIATNLPGVIYRFVASEDGDVVCEYISEGVEDIFGLKPEAVTADASRLAERLHPDDRGWLVSARDSGKNELESVGSEIRVVTDGPTKWIRVCERPYCTSSGETVHEGVLFDVTPHKALETAAREAEERLTTAIESIREGFALFDAGDRLVVFNPRFVDFFHQVSDVLKPGTSFETLFGVVVERGLITNVTGPPERWLAEQLKRHRNPRGTMEYRLEDGRWLLVAERKTAAGGVATVYADVTELKRREHEIVREIARRGSPNHRLLLDLIEKGATLEGTENPQLLLEEYRLLKTTATALGQPEEREAAIREYEDESRRLLEERDRFIAGRIAATLREGETGMLFIGALHRVDRVLPDDIALRPLAENPAKG